MTTAPKKFCFILMPFAEHFDDVYQLGIKQSCIDAGAYCERVDEQIYQESMVERIYNQISKADIIIADMTDRNPNVFYEVGYAHALGKTTILLTKDAEDIPFDLKHYPHIVYNGKISYLKEELTKRIKWFIHNSNENKNNYKVDFELYMGEQNLSQKGVIFNWKKNAIPVLNLTLLNKSFKSYGPGDYSIGVITDSNFTHLRNKQSKTIKLPDGNLMHMYPPIDDSLYPESYGSIQIQLEPKIFQYGNGFDSNTIYYQGEQEVTIRIFTSNGSRDFYVTIKSDLEKREQLRNLTSP